MNKLRKIECKEISWSRDIDGKPMYFGKERIVFHGYFHKWSCENKAIVEKVNGRVEVIDLNDYIMTFIDEFPEDIK